MGTEDKVDNREGDSGEDDEDENRGEGGAEAAPAATCMDFFLRKVLEAVCVFRRRNMVNLILGDLDDVGCWFSWKLARAEIVGELTANWR